MQAQITNVNIFFDFIIFSKIIYIKLQNEEEKNKIFIFYGK